MVRLIPNFDFIKGRQHNVRTLVLLTTFLERSGHIVEGLEHWGKLFVFDALIGNTDRHQDNWGILWYSDKEGWMGQFAPAFDNGTALGHEILDPDLSRFTDSNVVDRYVARGRHHVRWTSVDPKRCGHIELVSRYAGFVRPSVKSAMIETVESIDIDTIATQLAPLCQFDVPVSLSPERLEFILRLVNARKLRLREALGI